MMGTDPGSHLAKPHILGNEKSMVDIQLSEKGCGKTGKVFIAEQMFILKQKDNMNVLQNLYMMKKLLDLRVLAHSDVRASLIEPKLSNKPVGRARGRAKNTHALIE